MTALPPDVVADLSRENARLQAELRVARDRQNASADILRTIAGTSGDADRSLYQIAETSMRLFGATSATIQIAEGDGWSQIIRVGDSSKRIGAGVPEAQLRIGGRNMPGTIVAENRQVHVPDLDNVDPAIADWPGLPYARAAGTRSMSGSPLRREGKAIGALIVYRDRFAPFTDEELALQQSFADQAAIAIENARLFNETQAALKRQNASAEILRAIASTPGDSEQSLQQIAETTARLFGAQSVDFRIAAGDEWVQTIRVGVSAQRIGTEVTAAQVRIGARNLPGTVVRENRQIHAPDLENLDPEMADWPGLLVARASGTRTVAGTPLRREGKAIGALIVYRDQFAPFTAEELALQQSFADQAVIAIENARLFNETREALERQTATADILKVIASSPSDVQPVFEAIATNSKQLVGGFSTAVFRFVDGMARLAAYTPISPAADEVLKASFPRPVAELQFFDLAKGGQVVQEADTENNPDGRLKELARARGFRSALLSPLMNKETPIGLIVVTRKEPGTFPAHHVQLLQTFADQAVIAIENVRLFDEVQAKTRDLSESLQQQTATADVLKVISRSAFDLQSVLDTLVTSASTLCSADQGMLLLFEGGVLKPHSYFGPHPEKFEFRKSLAAAPHCGNLSGRAVLDGQIAHVADVLIDPEFTNNSWQELTGFRAMLAVPLMRQGQPIGAMALSRTMPGLFADRQIELVTTFADQAVIAIENVRLFDEVQQRTRELAASLEDLRTAQDRLIQTEKLASLGQLTAGIAHEIKNPLNFVNNFAALSAELTDELNDVLKPLAFAGKAREEIDELTGMLKDNLEKVVQHGKRADSIVKNMLLHSREGSGDHRPADINALLDESLNLAYHGARAEKPAFNVTLQRDFDANAGTIEVFPQEITRVFLNLIANGFYAVAKRKAETANSGFDPILSAATRNLGDTVEIRIRDNGTGIPTEVKDKMFNPFFTTKPAGEGTGLGLSMSHDIIVKQHGGSIDVETAPGQFTEFKIVLPRTSNPSSRNRGQA
jgi:two-component system NtrC family sensor kinase